MPFEYLKNSLITRCTGSEARDMSMSWVQNTDPKPLNSTQKTEKTGLYWKNKPINKLK